MAVRAWGPRIWLTFLVLFLTVGGSCSTSGSEAQPIFAQGGSSRRRLKQLDFLQKALAKYPSHEELEIWLTDFTKRCSAISNYKSIGTSVNSR